MASPQEIIARTGISYAFKNIQTSVKVVFWFIHNWTLSLSLSLSLSFCFSVTLCISLMQGATYEQMSSYFFSYLRFVLIWLVPKKKTSTVHKLFDQHKETYFFLFEEY